MTGRMSTLYICCFWRVIWETEPKSRGIAPNSAAFMFLENKLAFKCTMTTKLEQARPRLHTTPLSGASATKIFTPELGLYQILVRKFLTHQLGL